MNYEETLERIHSFHRYGSRLGLERMTVLMDFLGNPQDRMKVIHVAGTNGKGSVCRYLASILQENGYKTGLYTSPYIERFTERIEFDGREISEEDLVECADKVFRAVDRMIAAGYESPTEFELVTAMGFVYFAGKPLDILLLEVGLGGRGDSTNIIKEPLASVITSISYDHMEVLGDTLEKIAREKAGIIKPGCPVISNVGDVEASETIREIAEERGSSFYDVSRIEPRNVEESLDGYSFDIEGGFNGPGTSLRVNLSMIGHHQISNAICALSVIKTLSEKGIISCKAEKIQSGLKKGRQKGRLEILKRDPWLIIDGAHNEAGVEALIRVIRNHFHGCRLLLIIGILADKEVGRILKSFSALPADIAATEPDNPRKLSAEQLCERVIRSGRNCAALGDWEKACDYVEKEMHNYDAVIISGSLYLIGKVRGRFTDENEESITGV